MVIRDILQKKGVNKSRIGVIESMLTLYFGFFLSKLAVSRLDMQGLKDFEEFLDSDNSDESKEKLMERIITDSLDMSLDGVYEAYEEMWVESILDTDKKIEKIISRVNDRKSEIGNLDEEILNSLTNLADKYSKNS